jgi:nucleoside-diphosphate-sugar epimerase
MTPRDNPRSAKTGHRRKRPLLLITGSNGDLGPALAESLGKQCDIVGLDLHCAGADHPCIETDLTDDASLAAALASVAREHGRQIAVVFHLAAHYDLSGDDHPLYESLNVDGTRRLLRALKRDFEIGLFVCASTMLVHAPTVPGVPITEEAPLGAKWAYPRSKLEAERAVREEHGDLPAVLLRIAGVYTDDCGSPFIAHQIQRLYERRVTTSLYAGNPGRGQSFIHVDDLLALCMRLVERRDRFEHVTPLLAGEPEVLSYQAIHNRLAELLHGAEGWRTHGVPQAVAWLAAHAQPLVPDAPDDEQPFVKPYMTALAQEHYEIDIGRARALLDWSPRHRLRETLPRMVDALKADPAGWYQRQELIPPAWLTTATAENNDPDVIRRAYDRVRRDEHDATRWTHFMNIGLGAWLVTSPPTLGYADPAMTVSDIASGAAVMLFAMLSLSWRLGWARLATAAVGLWLMLAPLVFRAPEAAGYLNDTLVGALVFCLAVVVAPMPGIAPLAKLTGPDIPPGWDYSPSDWTQRVPIIALAFVGLLISRYLAAFQLGHTPGAWDPFFGGGTERVITSSVSGAWPVPSAGLGALTYLLEIVIGLLGGRARWRTMPWAVVLFGILIVPLGAVSIFFIIMQPMVYGTWCTLCLVAALAMLLQIPYAYDELLAAVQFLLERRRKGKPLLRVFLFGDTADVELRGEARKPAPRQGAVLPDVLGGGVNVPWTLALSALIGVGLMCTRLLFDTTGAQAHSDHLLGALVVSVSICALGEVGRPLRFANMLLGAGLMGAPFLFDGGSQLADAVGIATGALLILLAIPRGKVASRYGSWNRYIV